MIDIWFEAHAQTYHNAAGLASGYYDVALTGQGREHAQTVLRARYAGQPLCVNVPRRAANAPLMIWGVAKTGLPHGSRRAYSTELL